MEIVDANAGLLSNFEVYEFLNDPQRNNYPSYPTYLTRLEVQKNTEFATSFLSAKEADKYRAEELAEEALNQHQAALEGGESAAAAAAAASASAASDGVTEGRDLKPLENTCWIKSKVLQYLSTTPAATQTADSVGDFIVNSKSLMKDRAGEDRTKEEDTRLTVCELIQLVNLRPASLVEIHRAIEECEERLSEEDTLALLELIERTLPTAPPRAGAQSAEGEEEPQDMQE